MYTYLIVINKEFYIQTSRSKIKSTGPLKEIDYELIIFLEIKASYPI